MKEPKFVAYQPHDCHCLRCDYKWSARLSDPKCCPYCKARNWRTPRQEQKEPASAK